MNSLLENPSNDVLESAVVSAVPHRLFKTIYWVKINNRLTMLWLFV